MKTHLLPRLSLLSLALALLTLAPLPASAKDKAKDRWRSGKCLSWKKLEGRNLYLWRYGVLINGREKSPAGIEPRRQEVLTLTRECPSGSWTLLHAYGRDGSRLYGATPTREGNILLLSDRRGDRSTPLWIRIEKWRKMKDGIEVYTVNSRGEFREWKERKTLLPKPTKTVREMKGRNGNAKDPVKEKKGAKQRRGNKKK